VLKLSLDCGAIDPQRAKRYRRLVNLHFQLAPLGLFGFLKKLALPFLRLRAPTPDVLTSQSDVDHYVMSHTMLAASTFMIAASGVGLGTCPMEGFDEFRLKKLLKIPRQMRVPIIVAIGYPLEGHATPRTPRIPIQERVSIDYYARRPVGKKTS
jgi:nitroreductase